MFNTKKYYWLKLFDNFFADLKIKKLKRLTYYMLLIFFIISIVMFENSFEAISIAVIIFLFYHVSKNNYYTFDEKPHFVYKSSFKTKSSKLPKYSHNKDDILQIDFTKLPRKFPKCPNCGSKMNIKTTLYGDHRGARFWGCSQYKGNNKLSCKTMLHLYNLTELI